MKTKVKTMLFVCCALLSACGNRQTVMEQPEYPVLQVEKDSVTLVESYSATIEGRQNVEIYPQVSGTISRLCVSEGEQVRKGQSLFVIPQSATYEVQDKVYVYKVVEGKAVATEIKVAKLNDGKNYIVRSGISEGDVLVAEGVGMINDGQEISITKR